jgi:two-component system chemotaxis response regulator CheY
MTQPSTDFRALVADPSTHMAGLVTLMLHSIKVRGVDEAVNLQRAALLLGQRPYDLVLIDAHLGGEDNYALIRNLRQTAGHPNRDVPIIMMAASPDAAMIAAARDAGVSEFLRKPFSAHHIQLRIEAIRNAPREFVTAETYAGPDRRRRNTPATKHRRASDTSKKIA